MVADYSQWDGGAGLSIQNSGYGIKNGWNIATGSATPAGEPGTGSLKVAFEGMPEIDDEPNYTVLDTDYDTYSIVYSCGNFYGLFTFDLLWVLARENTFSADANSVVAGIIAEKLPSYDFEKNALHTRHGNFCPYEDRFAPELY